MIGVSFGSWMFSRFPKIGLPCHIDHLSLPCFGLNHNSLLKALRWPESRPEKDFERQKGTKELVSENNS